MLDDNAPGGAGSPPPPAPLGPNESESTTGAWSASLPSGTGESPTLRDSEFPEGGQAGEVEGTAETTPTPGPDIGRGLGIWLGILVIFGAGGLLLGQQEMAFLVVISGVFIAAQAADVDPRWEWLYRALLAVIVLFAALAFSALAATNAQLDLAPGLRTLLISVSVASAAIALMTLYVPFANALVRVLFRVPYGSHSLRLAARLTLFGLMFTFPGWFASRQLFETLLEDPSKLMEQLSLGGGLIGYIMLAVASVGLLVRRDLAATLKRIGVLRPTPVDVLIMFAGAALLFALNGGGEAVQRHWFPELWEHDRRMSEAIAGGLTRTAAVMLGLSAGIGEEITLRGSLQPKLGIPLTALLFAALHVQYSWFGMLMIFIFGCVLGLIRKRTSTTVAMGVHSIYDVAALLLA